MFNSAIKFILIVLPHFLYYFYSAAAATSQTICSSDVNKQDSGCTTLSLTLDIDFF